MPGEDEQSGDDGWETSTELPGGDEETGAGGEDEQTGGGGEEEEGGAGGEDDQTARPGGTVAGTPGSGDEKRRGGGGDEELEKQLEVFDGEILDSRETVLASANDRAGQGGQGGRRSLPGSEDATSGSPGTGDGASPDKPIRKGAVDAPLPVPRPAPVANRVPPDVPDAKDDDVVARQLREAAMAETDPELREALWDDYRRYKTGS